MATNLTSTLALAAGIGDGIHLDRWMQFSREADKEKPPAKSGVFHIEGPILGSSIEQYGDVKGATTPAMLREFLEANKGKDIEVQINSPGGSVFEANAMWSDLARHEGEITLVVTGACFSAAVDFMTLPDAKRIAMPGSMFMIHNAFTIAMGDSKTLQKVVDRLEKMNDQCADRMAKAWGEFDKKDLLAMMDDETWFTEQEALDAGIVQEVWEKAGKDDDATAESDENTRLAIERGTVAAASRLLAII